MSKEPRFPAITKAAETMARCNGGINRHRTVEDFREALAPILMHAPHDLDAIDKWLATRNDEQLLTIVDGEASDMEAELVTAPPGTDMLLHDIFEDAV